MWILLTHVTVYTALPFKFFVCKLKFVFLVMACKTRAWKAGRSRGVNFTTLQEINGFLASQMHVIYSKIYTLLVLARWDTITYFWAVLPPITSCLNDRMYMYWYHAVENTANQITGKQLSVHWYDIQHSHCAPHVYRDDSVGHRIFHSMVYR